MVGERGSPGCDVMATLPRVATPQKAFVLHADSQVWEADAGRKQVCISDSPTHTPISCQEKGLGTLGWKQRTLGGLLDVAIRWKETDNGEASFRA